MKKFKIGDRVILKPNTRYSSQSDKPGTILKLKDTWDYAVKWDNNNTIYFYDDEDLLPYIEEKEDGQEFEFGFETNEGNIFKRKKKGKFKFGDSVMINPKSRFYGRPNQLPPNVIGVIIAIEHYVGLEYKVEWRQLAHRYSNNYGDKDLILAKEDDDEFEFGFEANEGNYFEKRRHKKRNFRKGDKVYVNGYIYGRIKIKAYGTINYVLHTDKYDIKFDELLELSYDGKDMKNNKQFSEIFLKVGSLIDKRYVFSLYDEDDSQFEEGFDEKIMIKFSEFTNEGNLFNIEDNSYRPISNGKKINIDELEILIKQYKEDHDDNEKYPVIKIIDLSYYDRCDIKFVFGIKKYFGMNRESKDRYIANFRRYLRDHGYGSQISYYADNQIYVKKM